MNSVRLSVNEIVTMRNKSRILIKYHFFLVRLNKNEMMQAKQMCSIDKNSLFSYRLYAKTKRKT